MLRGDAPYITALCLKNSKRLIRVKDSPLIFPKVHTLIVDKPNRDFLFYLAASQRTDGLELPNLRNLYLNQVRYDIDGLFDFLHYNPTLKNVYHANFRANCKVMYDYHSEELTEPTFHEISAFEMPDIIDEIMGEDAVPCKDLSTAYEDDEVWN